ncbi:hypothetical protein HanIR_Chr05g0226871 [Helianthus annuus]|nr:hypothetical protein HanIR_Chr05g0226871 [Helianthus annuus]
MYFKFEMKQSIRQVIFEDVEKAFCAIHGLKSQSSVSWCAGRWAGNRSEAASKKFHSTTQGLQEFKNEVISISKLQHQNLVKL